MYRSSDRIKLLFILLICVCFCFSLSGAVSADEIPEEADQAFWDTLRELESDGLISLDGRSIYYGDYKDEWAQLSWYQWLPFEQADRFVLSSKVSWDSASRTPNNFESGCGVIFNASDQNSNHLLASVRMDGRIYFTGKRNMMDLSYGNYQYGTPSIKNTVDLLLVVDHDSAAVYIDGKRVVQKSNLLILGNTVGLSTLSGTNRDFGTRCTWQDIFFYTW